MSDENVDDRIAAVKAQIEAKKKEAELKALEAELAGASEAKTDVAPVASGIVTGIENQLTDPEVAQAYEAHKTKTPVTDKKEPLASQIVQYLTIFRMERVDFTHQSKHCLVRHDKGGALFLSTPSGHDAFEIVTDKGRQTLQAALMDRCDLRTLSTILSQMSIALATSPRLPPGSEDSNAQAGLRAAINKLRSSAKTKDELAAAIMNLLG